MNRGSDDKPTSRSWCSSKKQESFLYTIYDIKIVISNIKKVSKRSWGETFKLFGHSIFVSDKDINLRYNQCRPVIPEFEAGGS